MDIPALSWNIVLLILLSPFFFFSPICYLFVVSQWRLFNALAETTGMNLTTALFKGIAFVLIPLLFYISFFGGWAVLYAFDHWIFGAFG